LVVRWWRFRYIFRVESMGLVISHDCIQDNRNSVNCWCFLYVFSSSLTIVSRHEGHCRVHLPHPVVKHVGLIGVEAWATVTSRPFVTRIYHANRTRQTSHHCTQPGWLIKHYHIIGSKWITSLTDEIPPATGRMRCAPASIRMRGKLQQRER